MAGGGVSGRREEEAPAAAGGLGRKARWGARASKDTMEPMGESRRVEEED
uniref:Uncharacterized protein n=1 Tax=Arundo donax TaxID=35708 RepID=A0A0A9ECA2_ARUDO